MWLESKRMELDSLKRRIVNEGTRLGRPLRRDEVERLFEFFALLSRWGKSIRLTGSRDTARLIEEHLADALIMSRVIGRVSSFADVGSGGGLPAIPYLILEPAQRALLVESNQRKAAFLRTAVHELGLTGCEVEDRRVEALEEQKPPFDLVSSRATFAPAEWLVKALPLVAKAGVVLVFVAREERAPTVSPPWVAGDLHAYELADHTPRALACYHRLDA